MGRFNAIERGEQIVAAVAKAAGVAILDDRGAADELLNAMAVSSSLAVLYNCEHLRRDIESWVALVFAKAPATRVLATSQEPSHHAEARAYPLDALAQPTPDAKRDAIRPSAAVELLELRACADS